MFLRVCRNYLAQGRLHGLGHHCRLLDGETIASMNQGVGVVGENVRQYRSTLFGHDRL